MNNIYKITSMVLVVLALTIYFSACSDSTTTPGTVSLTSDLTRTGKFISFTSNMDGDYDIYLAQVNTDGSLATGGLVFASNPYNLTHSLNPALGDMQSNWSPNGRILVFSKQQNVAGLREIYAYFFKADGSIDSGVAPNPRQILSSGGSWDENPQFSPDGKYLVWDKREDNQAPIGIIDTSDFRDIMRGTIGYDSSGIITGVTSVTYLTTTLNSDEYDPKWSPKISVQRVAYTLRSSATSNDFDVWIIDPLNAANGSTNFFNPGRSSYPAWAPLCDRIIFEADQGNGGFFKIVSLAYPTNNGTLTDLVQSSSQNMRYPTRMPNADRISYVQINQITGFGSIYVTSATTGGAGFKLLPVTFDASDCRYPAW